MPGFALSQWFLGRSHARQHEGLGYPKGFWRGFQTRLTSKKEGGLFAGLKAAIPATISPEQIFRCFQYFKNKISVG